MNFNKKNKFIVYYDGNCPICNTFANTVSTKDKDQSLIDANQPNIDTVISKEKLLNEIHLIDKDGKTRTGADAIFTSLSRINPIFKIFSFLVRLPILSSLANIIYSFIAKRRLLWLGGNNARLYWLFIVVNLGLLSSLLLSYPAWSADRSYPLTPILSGLDWLTPLTTWLFGALVISLFLNLFQFKGYHRFTITSLLLLLPLVFLDISRLQPWILHYSAILFLLSWSKTLSSLRTSEILDAARLVVIGIYFWSGIQKMNTAFVLEVFPWFTEPLWSTFGQAGAITVLILGIFIPFIEAAFAIGLLTRRFRNISRIGSIGMLILVTLSLMIGHGWNSVVWPWNFAIFSMVLILFYRYDSTLSELINRLKTNFLAWLAAAIFIVMPLGNYFGLVDHYLSWSLYSGHVPTASINASEEIIKDLSPISNLKDDNVLPVLTWTMDTMNLVPYPEKRVFFNVFSNICHKYKESNMTLTVTTRPLFESNKITDTTYTCSSPEILHTE